MKISWRGVPYPLKHPSRMPIFGQKFIVVLNQ